MASVVSVVAVRAGNRVGRAGRHVNWEKIMSMVLDHSFMAAPDSDTPWTGESLERHVLAPIAAAEDVLERERERATAERGAFERFADSVRDVDPVSVPVERAQTRALTVDTDPQRIDRVRRAFRETVMSVPHYEDAYGESLCVHAASELTIELAAGLKPDADSRFTPSFRQALLASVDDAVDERETYGTVLDEERRSLANGREALTSLLQSPDGPAVPGQERAATTRRLDEIAATRQETLRRRNPLVSEDGHDLCPHLYPDHPWTYPLLTAIARFRASLDARQGPGSGSGSP